MRYPPMSSTNFDLVYHGEAVRQGVMDVRDLSPALLAAGRIFEGANQSLNGSHAEISVGVRADFQAASFHLSIEIAQSVVESTPTFLDAPPIVSAVDLVRLFGAEAGSFIGLVQFLKWLRGRRVVRTQEREDRKVQIEVAGDDATIINGNVYQIFRTPSVRGALPDLISPLHRDGIDRLEIGQDDQIAETVNESEADFFEDDTFELSPTVEERSVSSSRRRLELVSVHFRRARKWRFTDGANYFWVEVFDEPFLERVRQHDVVFGMGDLLDVELEVQTSQTEEGVKTLYRATHVYEHRPAARQGRFRGPDFDI